MSSDLTTDQSRWVRTWLESSIGVRLSESQQYLLDTRLPAAARTLGQTTGEMVTAAQRGNRPAINALVDALTTNETSWYRDIHPFEALRKEIIPALLDRGASSLTIWSAAASAGQELYSVAMLLRDHFPTVADHPATRLVGTDISAAMIAKATAGRYTQIEMDRGLPARNLVRYFQRDGLDWVVNDDLRRMVRFSVGNLLTDPAPGSFDIVLCRNVLIYFDTPVRIKATATIQRGLKPGGVMLLGSSELPGPHTSAFTAVTSGRVTYYRAS